MGVMRVGALARGLMLQGERQMEVVLMMKSMCIVLTRVSYHIMNTC